MNRFGICRFALPAPLLRKEPRSGQRWRLAAPWTAVWEDRDGPRALLLPAEFDTDLMTSPLKPAGDETIPALLHDGLYELQPPWCSRDYADDVFFAAMLHCGVDKAFAEAAYFAVQAFGFVFWEQHRRIGAPLSAGNVTV